MNRLVVIFILLLVSGCSPSKVYLVHQPKILHFSTPETSGGFAEGNVVVTAGFKEPEYVFGFIETDSLLAAGSNASNSIQESTQKRDKNLNFFINFGLLENIDAYLDISGILGVQVQLMGGSKLMKDEGLKLSLGAKYGKLESKNQGYNEIGALFVRDVNVANASSTTKLFGLSANIGYRYNPNHLTYINSFVSKSDFTGKLWSDQEAIYRTAQTSSQTLAVLLGYQYTTDSDIFYILEAGAAQISWSNRGTVWSFPFGLSYGRSW